ncbi:type II/IV secretion system ATPase subunit [Candidatus Woesearchaeota archaeon]|jgi:archaeal flagellar protein FlaI|nr:type II/IV secretion system ATPase subunit [Candidatus Woesearchaeota archaeon]MBT6519629.1 type II/IV secretion system ATPase subunit [Candidatus Woesearchaeota archaeon]MBT7367544.1 type II/IV secretion system ATPase subunit [Candidatus Woesearchaeota archaeon]
MTIFGAKVPLFGYEIITEGEDNIMRINYEGAAIVPSLEENGVVMSKTCDNLIESPETTKIVFSQRREYEYDLNQVNLIKEIAQIFDIISRNKDKFSYQKFLPVPEGKIFANKWYAELQNVLFHLIKSDPVGAYVELRRIYRREKINYDKLLEEKLIPCFQSYFDMIQFVLDLLEKSKLITVSKPFLAGFKQGDREVYRKFFHPFIKPDFMYAKLMADYPAEGEEMANYTVGVDTEVTVFKLPESVQYLYHIMPPEFKLSEEEYELLDLARNILAEHKPTRKEFTDPQRMREIFESVGRDLLEELSAYRNMNLAHDAIIKLSKILVRYTVGFGLVEVLLQDEQIQDISVNSPQGRIPIFLVHGEFADCITNVIPTRTEAESWATKLRMISGRPLDEANVILDTELVIPGARVRVSTITEPLDPSGLAFSFRRHRDRPWTLPLFIKYDTINSLGAGLLSFIVDGTRSMMICGTRSSGKTAFLTGILIEIMRRYRVITVEDTLELPTDSMRHLGYNIQPMKVASALAKGSSEMSAADGIRSTLRLGDSALIVGEVRSKEAVALYEAMRVGAAANVVAGTIHADSPFGLFDRVVNDIGVPKTSFKATDIIIIATPIKSPDGLHKWRRITQITEVRKTWQEDPLLENGFIDLMKYDSKTDQLVPTDDLLDGNSEILKLIAANIPDFAGDWDAVWNNIELRAKIKESIVKKAKEIGDDEMFEAPFVIKCNDVFHLMTEKVKSETGKLDSDKIFFEWNTWFERAIRKRKINKGLKEDMFN